MQQSMTLEGLLNEVVRQGKVKMDKIASTEKAVRMVPDHSGGSKDSFLVLQAESGALERYAISEHAHGQIAARLNIPRKHYFRLLSDYPDLVRNEVNTIFEKEPESRLFRVLDGTVRAFLSDRYYRLDNDAVLESSLPAVIKGDHETRLLRAHITPDRLDVTCLFTGDGLAHEVARANGAPRIIRPGFRISNSETGAGAFKVEAFFFDHYCTNGCVFGQREAFTLSRTHLGGRLIEGESFQVVSRETHDLEAQAMASSVRDALTAISNPENVARMAEKLRAAAQTEKCKAPVAAVELAVKILPLRESERDGILETFLRDGDYTQYGMASAVTAQANNAEKCSVDRALELEDIGAQILSLDLRQWTQYARAERLAA